MMIRMMRTMGAPTKRMTSGNSSTRANASFLYNLTGVARLRDGATVANANAELTGLIVDLSRVYPNQRGIVSTALPLQTQMVGPVATTLASKSETSMLGYTLWSSVLTPVR